MKTNHITGDQTTPYNVDRSKEIFVLDKGASIKFDGIASFSEDQAYHDNRFVIKGTIIGGDDYLQTAIKIHGDGSDVLIAQSGKLNADTGVELAGEFQSLRNEGRIIAREYGVLADENGTIDNAGLIKAVVGISTLSPSVSVTNLAEGRIVTIGPSIVFFGDENTHSTLVNHGLIKSTGTGGDAVQGLAGNDTITNRGTMLGGIHLGAGNDRFDNRSGRIDHDVVGQMGDDMLIADKAGTQLVEVSGEGSDTVKATVTYKLSANVENLVLLGKGDTNGLGNAEANEIDGNKGDNKLVGKAGRDTLDGFGGDDVMSGGADADVFLFAAKGGHDTITDFNDSEDHIDLSGQDIITDFDDMMAHHVTISGGDLTIHVGKGTLTLENIGKGDLDFMDVFF